MTRALRLLAAALVCSTTPLFAQSTRPTTRPIAPPATAPTTRPTVVVGDPDELLNQLASPDWHVRRQAQNRLVRAGEDAKPFIQDLIRRATDDEARKNAQAALIQIDENRVTGPSYITLHVKDASPAQVFAEISRQCYAPLLTFPDNLWEQQSFPKITLDVDRQPFWKVVPPICQKLGVDFRPAQNGMRLMRIGGMRMQGISHIDGAFLIVANQISYSRTRAFGGGEQTQFGMNLSIYPEPKITVLRSGTVKVDAAVDDHGNSLVPLNLGRQTFWGGSGGLGGWSLYVPLQYPNKNPGHRLVTLRGSTHLVIQTEVRKLEIGDLAHLKNVNQFVNGMHLTFEEMNKSGDDWQLHLRVDGLNFGGPEWQQLQEGIQNRLQVLDTNGNALNHQGLSSNSSRNSVEFVVSFGHFNPAGGRMPGDPAKLVWDIPTRTREIDVPIEFKDLPLFDKP